MDLSKSSANLASLLETYRSFRAATVTSHTEVLPKFLYSFKNYLELDYAQHKREWKQEFAQDYSVLMGGDLLHLSSAYREEHVTAWLQWILSAPLLSVEDRGKFLTKFFDLLMAAPEFRRYCKHGGINHIEFTGQIEFESELAISSESRLDLIIKTKDSVMVIENKIGDMGLAKNIRYRELIEKKWGDKNLCSMLILPKRDLDDYLATTSQSESDKVLTAFPPVSWETVLSCLRICFEDGFHAGEANVLWRALVYSFISFVEGNVLGYNLKAIRGIFVEGKDATYFDLAEIRRYHQYRCDRGVL